MDRFERVEGFLEVLSLPSITSYSLALGEGTHSKGVSRKRINDKNKQIVVQLFGMDNINVLFSAQHKENKSH